MAIMLSLQARFSIAFLSGGCLMCGAAAADDIRIGILAFQGSDRAIEEFEPTRAWLEGAAPGRNVRLEPLDLAGIAQAVEDRRVDFIVTNPGQYVDLESRFGATRIATLETQSNGAQTDTLGSIVVARNVSGSPATLADLAGRRLAIVSIQAFGGYQMVWREMDDAGLRPAKLGAIVETGFPMDRVLHAVREGLADAGVLRSCLLEKEIADGRARAGEFAVVGERTAPGFPCRLSTRLYPDWPFAKARETSPALAKAVAARLLAMPATDGRAWTAPLDYTPVHALFQQLKIGPYAYLAKPSLSGLLREYWQYLAAALLVAGWWIVHVARVESLVRRRTGELEREIHERERAEQEARENREQRDQFSRLGIMGEMASNIAHELNQPLAAIANYAEGITRMIDSGRADQAMLRDGARGVAGQAERAAAIIQRIRSFVRRREAKREIVDPNEIVRETVALFEGLAARRGAKLHLHLADDVPRVSADSIEIQQVLLNLLQNAVDAMSENKAQVLEKAITVRTSRVGADAKFVVRDFGPGLTREVEAHLFETFFTTKPQGLGLGLSICRTIVESHGGRLWATQNDDAGLTMRFILPGAKEERPA
jgi:two-component system, LuxR family, sensor histidine kinase TtrS